MTKRPFAIETPTKSEARAYQRGMDEYRRGNFVTLQSFLHEVESNIRPKTKKRSKRKAV